MRIAIEKTVVEYVQLNLKNLRVFRTGARDMDSTNLEIHYDGFEYGIAYGHLNNRTNTAHITISDGLMNEVDESELIDYIVEGIENRILPLQ